ncbi:DNA-3-methyladenine glycosylase, putative, partial [Perkinsus marinus ATCC 50983]
MSGSEVVRCGWVGKYTGAGREDYVKYHDNEWGVPVVADDRLMFEMISLEGAQAGLSWATILAKRSGYKKAFKDFDIEALVRATEEASSMDVLVDAVLDSDCDVVRSRRKIESVYRNAEAARAVREE